MAAAVALADHDGGLALFKCLDIGTVISVLLAFTALQAPTYVKGTLGILHFILSRPHMKRFRINVLWKDKITHDRDAEIQAVAPHLHRTVESAEDVPTSYSELTCVESYPPATSVIMVNFDLRDTSVLRNKPYSMSHKKKT